MKTTIRDLALGMPFRIPGRDTIYVTRGGTWYGTPLGYDGGPWTLDENTTIEPVPTHNLHSMSFIGLSNDELDAARLRIYGEASDYGEGDKALIQSEYAKRELTFPKS
jgi:hypothetical protein